MPGVSVPFLRNRKAFTLVEIMIVVAILGLLAAIAVGSALRARLNSNEAAAKTDLHTLSTALENFRAAQTPTTYPPSLATLVVAIPAYVDPVLGSGTKQGYNFVYTFVNPNQYTIQAVPRIPNVTGSNRFHVDESGVIRLNDANGPPIE